MTYFEEAALSTAPFQPLCFYRKVDETFTTIASDNDQLQGIKFTMETVTNHDLPFLDVSLHTTDDGLRNSVYRKPTHTDQYIHYNSCHHPHIKQAIIASLTRRAKGLCHPDALNRELDHPGKTFTTLNGYHAQLITATINKTLKDRETASSLLHPPSE
ncbi:uncharacterized protein [Haliotis asinina]|uniref:uncharacterized protein n=1 Tax=Haliotis asinina TaxID=109174 RepID=UPI0035327017